MEKKATISLMSCLSCIAVVFIHTNGCFWDFSADGCWVSANFIESLTYFCIPCFFMITGATLIDYRDRCSTRVYFKRRFEKTFLPFLFWSLAGLFFGLFITGNFSPSDLSFAYVWNGVLKTRFVSIYWFFPTLFCLYLCLPLFAAVDKGLRREVFSGFVFAGFFCNLLIPLLQKLFFQDLAWPFTIRVVSGPLIYLLLGWLLENVPLSKRSAILIYAGALLGFCLLFFGTWAFSFLAGEVDSTFKEYSNVPALLYSAGVYTLVKRRGEALLKVPLVRRIVALLSPCTLGVYLLQYYLYTVFAALTDLPARSLLYRLGTPFVLIPAAVLITRLLRRIPFLRRCVP